LIQFYQFFFFFFPCSGGVLLVSSVHPNPRCFAPVDEQSYD